MNEGTRGIWKSRGYAYGDGGQQVLRGVVLTLTNAQCKALRATPITIVGAPLAGFILNPIDCLCELVYGGTNAFTANAGDNIAVKWQNGSGVAIIQGAIQAMLQATASAYSKFVPSVAAGSTINVAKSAADGQPLVLHNIGAAEIAGNAGNDNTLRFTLTYTIVPSV